MNHDLKYSLRTIALAFEALSQMPSKAGLKFRLMECTLTSFFSGGTMKEICLDAMQKLLEQDPSALEDVVEDVAKNGPKTEAFLNSLKADGFNVTKEGNIVTLLATAVPPAKEESVLEELLSELGWGQTKQHLSEGISSYEHGNWAAANAQFRTFLEDIFNQIANSRGIRKSGGEARCALQEEGFLSEKEGEMVQGVFNFLHTKGSHPGMSEEFESRMRRYLVEVIALYFIEKFQKSNTEDVSF